MSEWIDCPKCGTNHENLCRCPEPQVRQPEEEKTNDTPRTDAVVSPFIGSRDNISIWREADLLLDHSRKLERELKRMRIWGIGRDDEMQRQAKLALEARTELAAERERSMRWHDEAQAAKMDYMNVEKKAEEAHAKLAKLSRMIDLSQAATDRQSEAEVAASASFNEALAITAGQITEDERDAWRECARELHLALSNDGVETNNPMSKVARDLALLHFKDMEK